MFLTKRDLNNSSSDLNRDWINQLLTTHTFQKAERLNSKKKINELFERGSVITEFPLRCIFLYTPLDTPYPAQVAFAIPKRKFNKATERNFIRRKIKEAYRLNKTNFYKHLLKHNQQISLIFIYTGKKNPEFIDIKEKIIIILDRLTKTNETDS